MSKDEYLITDTPLKALTVFAMPMILGSFFQQIYNMADSVIVGQFVGSSALAAVGACAALTNVFICVHLLLHRGSGWHRRALYQDGRILRCSEDGEPCAEVFRQHRGLL